MNQSGFADLKNQSTINADSLIVDVLILPGLDPNSVLTVDANNEVADVVLNSGELIIGRTGNAPVANTLTGTTDEIIVTTGPGSITLSTPQQIAPTSNPTFNDLSVSTINGKNADDLVTGTGPSILKCCLFRWDFRRSY